MKPTQVNRVTEYALNPKNGPFMCDPEKVRVVESGAGYRTCSCLAMAEKLESGDYSTVQELASDTQTLVSLWRAKPHVWTDIR